MTKQEVREIAQKEAFKVANFYVIVGAISFILGYLLA